MYNIRKSLPSALFFSFAILVANSTYAMDIVENEQPSKKPPCAPKRLTHENLRAIFTPTDADYEIIETEKGRQKPIKTQVEIHKTLVNVYCAPKTFKKDEIRRAIENNPNKKMIGVFKEFMMKERLDHTLAGAKIGLNKAAIASYKLYLVEDNVRRPIFDIKKAEGNIEDPNLIHIAFATKAEWLPDDEVAPSSKSDEDESQRADLPAATRAFKILSREMLLSLLQGGDQPISLIGPDKEGNNVTAYYKAKFDGRDKAKIPAIIKLLEAPAGVELFAMSKKLYGAGASDTMTAVSDTPYEGEDWIYQLYSKEGDGKRKAVEAPKDIKSSAERHVFFKLKLTFYKPTKKS